MRNSVKYKEVPNNGEWADTSVADQDPFDTDPAFQFDPDPTV